jgi:hypothetical protein
MIKEYKKRPPIMLYIRSLLLGLILVPSISYGASELVAWQNNDPLVNGWDPVNTMLIGNYNTVYSTQPITDIYIKEVKQATNLSLADNNIYFQIYWQYANTPRDCKTVTKLRSAWGIPNTTPTTDSSSAGSLAVLHLEFTGTECVLSQIYYLKVVGLSESTSVRYHRKNLGTGTMGTYTVWAGGTPLRGGFDIPTSITSFTYSTTTQYARIKGYWNATSTTGIHQELEFWQNSSIFGKEDYVKTVATTTGAFDFSFFFHGLPFATSTRNVPFGLYAWITEIDDRNVDPNWNPFNDGANPTGQLTTLLVSTSTIVTAFEYNLASIPLTPRISDGYSFAECTIAHFDMGLCMADLAIGLFQPTPQDYRDYINILNDEVYIHAPLGYIARFRDIVNNTPAGNMPVIDYTFSTSTNSALSSALGGQRIYLAPFDYATGTSITQIKSDGANGLPQQDIWTIMAPFYNTVLYLALMILVISDLLGIELIQAGAVSKNNKDN